MAPWIAVADGVIQDQTSEICNLILGKKCPLSDIYKQEGHDGPEIAHLSLLTKHAPSSFPVT